LLILYYKSPYSYLLYVLMESEYNQTEQTSSSALKLKKEKHQGKNSLENSLRNILFLSSSILSLKYLYSVLLPVSSSWEYALA